MYNLHQTEGFVLSSLDVGEADRIYNIYTKDFGLVVLRAGGIRLEKSKLRTNLNLDSFSRVSFIEGKEYLRLTDAEEIKAPPLDEKVFEDLASAGSLIGRMVKGQEKDEGLWVFIKSVFDHLYSGAKTGSWFLPLFEARFFHRLGYAYLPENSLGQLIAGDDWILEKLTDEEKSSLQKISKESLEASQL